MIKRVFHISKSLATYFLVILSWINLIFVCALLFSFLDYATISYFDIDNDILRYVISSIFYVIIFAIFLNINKKMNVIIALHAIGSIAMLFIVLCVLFAQL